MRHQGESPRERGDPPTPIALSSQRPQAKLSCGRHADRYRNVAPADRKQQTMRSSLEHATSASDTQRYDGGGHEEPTLHAVNTSKKLEPRGLGGLPSTRGPANWRMGARQTPYGLGAHLCRTSCAYQFQSLVSSLRSSPWNTRGALLPEVRSS